MREILFRGQRFDNGEWVYGMPLESKFGCTYMLTKQGGLNADFIYSRYTILDKKDSIPVVSESIGQFTGLLDKSGNEIFEGDIVRWDDNSNGEKWRVAVVEFNPDIQFRIIKIECDFIQSAKEGCVFRFGNFIYQDT